MRAIVCLLLAMLVLGCGKKKVGEPEDLLQIPAGERPKGTYLLARVKVGDKIFKGAQVILMRPEDQENVRTGVTDKNGVAMIDQLKTGKYLVGIGMPRNFKPPIEKPPETAPGKEAPKSRMATIPSKYNFPLESGLEVEILQPGENQIEFSLEAGF